MVLLYTVIRPTLECALPESGTRDSLTNRQTSWNEHRVRRYLSHSSRAQIMDRPFRGLACRRCVTVEKSCLKFAQDLLSSEFASWLPPKKETFVVITESLGAIKGQTFAP